MRRTETARKSRDEGFIDRLIKAVNRKSDSAKKSIAYIKKICSDPTVGAPNPGGKYLIERVLKAVNPKKCSVIIELGAGEGILTRKLLKAMPEVTLKDGVTLCTIIFESGFAPSKREARRLVDQGAVRLDGEKLTQDGPLSKEGVLQVGRRHFCRLKRG